MLKTLKAYLLTAVVLTVCPSAYSEAETGLSNTSSAGEANGAYDQVTYEAPQTLSYPAQVQAAYTEEQKPTGYESLTLAIVEPTQEADIQPASFKIPTRSPQRLWSASLEATYLTPKIKSGDVGFLYSSGVPLISGSEAADLDRFYGAPRLLVQTKKGRDEFLIRYWSMQAAENKFYKTLGSGSGTAGGAIHQQLKVSTFDFETAHPFGTEQHSKNFTFGSRLASLQNSKSLNMAADLTSSMQFADLASTSKVQGSGLTTSLSGRKQFSPNTNTYLVYNLRGSVIWGEIQNRAETSLLNSTSGGGTTHRFTTSDEAIFIGEAQLGLEIDFELNDLPADAFFRFMVEYQYWGARHGFAAPTFTEAGYSEASGIQLELIGVSLATGFTW